MHPLVVRPKPILELPTFCVRKTFDQINQNYYQLNKHKIKEKKNNRKFVFASLYIFQYDLAHLDSLKSHLLNNKK